MKNKFLAGCLAPVVRSSIDGEVKLLMTRRNFFDNLKRKPMRFPGEWVFAGGTFEPDKDKTTADTAKREFKEEMCYHGEIYSVSYLLSGSPKIGEIIYDMHLYLAKIDESPVFKYNCNGEVIGHMWGTPNKLIDIITSEEFDAEQEEIITEMDLMNPIYGNHKVEERQFPYVTIQILEHIIENGIPLNF